MLARDPGDAQEDTLNISNSCASEDEAPPPTAPETTPREAEAVTVEVTAVINPEEIVFSMRSIFDDRNGAHCAANLVEKLKSASSTLNTSSKSVS